MRIGKKLRRVDVQVSIMTILITLFSTSSVYFISYYLTYRDMIYALEDRAFAIHDFLEESIDKSTFVKIKTKEDTNHIDYVHMKELLESVKSSTGVRYLYTAKKNEEGEFIYVVDGLDEQAADFRYPGDAIEPEIREDMQRALDGETVLPKGIKSTDWGKIFVTYFPIHNKEQVIGVLGIEFEAGHQYKTYWTLRIFMPIIIAGTSFVFMLIAILMFRRISNPTYKDMYNTDKLTNLKSRNAFEIDIHNLDSRKMQKNVGIIVSDLNNLKSVNDKYGHGTGDHYIQTAGNRIHQMISAKGAAYRTGGDEFAVLLMDTDEEELKNLCIEIQKSVNHSSVGISCEIPLSISIGYRLFQPEEDKSLEEVFQRADEEMYADKERYHKQSKCRQRGEL